MEYTAQHARLDRRLKRRCIFNRNFKQDNSANVVKRILCNNTQEDYTITRDYDYEIHLAHIIEKGDPVDIGVPIVVDEPFLCENTDHIYVNNAEVDPDYMMLCKGLREVEKSYVLEVATGNGKLVVEYETKVLFDRYPISFVKSNNIKKRINAEPPKISWSSSSERAEKPNKSYMKYLDSFETSLKGRDNMVYTPCNTKLASDYDVGSCDSEVIILDFDPFANGSHYPFMTSKSVVVTVDVDSGSCLQSHHTSPSAQFREALLKYLKKPFNQAEYESLLEEVTCRKETLGHRELRSGIKSYKRESIGKSYLDIYGDLAAKINQVRSDRRRELNILRGFFYWLKNLAHEGAFPPWLDTCCVET